MRAVVRSAIINDITLQGLGVIPEGVLSGDVDSPTVETRPFINLKWGVTNPGIREAGVTQTNLIIWVHDTPNDYGRIDAICRRLRVVVGTLQGATDVDSGDYVSQAAWTGDSGDLSDDGHRTIARQSNYTLNGTA